MGEILPYFINVGKFLLCMEEFIAFVNGVLITSFDNLTNFDDILSMPVALFLSLSIISPISSSTAGGMVNEFPAGFSFIALH